MEESNDSANPQANGKTYIEAFEILSPREVEILKLTEKGLINRKISEILRLSIRTVQTHRSNIWIERQASFDKMALGAED